MSGDGLYNAPSLIIGRATLTGLPIDAFETSPAYQEAFSTAVEAAQCQCNVTDSTCITESCAGNVEILKMAGDSANTDIEFKVRVTPSRSAADTENTLTLEMHSESLAYRHKEIKAKRDARMGQLQTYSSEQHHERAQKAVTEANEHREKQIYQNAEHQKEHKAKEVEEKKNAQKWTAEKAEKEKTAKADAAQDAAAAASEKAMKAHMLHQEARSKRR